MIFLNMNNKSQQNYAFEVILVLLAILIVLVFVVRGTAKTGNSFFGRLKQIIVGGVTPSKARSICSQFYVSDSEKEMVERLSGPQDSDYYLSYLIYPPHSVILVNLSRYNDDLEKALILSKISSYCSAVRSSISKLTSSSYSSSSLPYSFFDIAGDGENAFGKTINKNTIYCVTCTPSGVNLREGECHSFHTRDSPKYLLYVYPVPGESNELVSISYLR